MEKKDWREELKQHIFAECFKDQVDIQWYEDFIEQELDRAREEGRKELVKEIREAIREDVNNSEYDTERRHISIDENIVRIINDGDITEMYMEQGGWGWYS